MRKFLFLILASMIFVSTAFAQTKTVSGKVLASDDNAPLTGAFVYVTNHNTSNAMTDSEGRFSISGVPSNAESVTVSMVGMKTIVAAITPNLVIYLDTDREVLDEVMIVAYGTVKKSSYSGSASMVKSSQLADLPASNFENALSVRCQV
ncbi:MAG: carboxypeptidase-like regulatory domain-containing protein [Bacteroidales bacterium]|nr:carboxypeptidase-like regulatory domain-containing protein [Bacteroidales bacterium]